jgi:surfactin family lipopeptide synthetase A
MTRIKELKQRSLNGDLSALAELRQLGVLSGDKSQYSMAPVSHAQRRLWFIDKMDRSPAYNLSAAILLEGELHVDALEQAFDLLIARHEILRTVFVETDGIPYQKIFNSIDWSMVEIDLRGSADKEEQASVLIARESSRCFDLSKGPLIVSSLLRLEEHRHLLLFNMHHIICDGWSMGVLTSELTLLYNSLRKGGGNPLEPLKKQYRDYVYAHLQTLKEERSGEHRAYWLNALSGELPVSELPSDFKRPLNKTFNGRVHEIVLDNTVHARMQNLCRQGNVSLFMFLVAVVNIMIHKCSGKTDILVGSPVAGREQRDLENQIGFYVNTIPLRNACDSALSVMDFLGRVKHNCIAAYDHQAYPFDLIVGDLHVERDTSRNPLFEIVVSLQELDSAAILFDGIQASVMKPEIRSGKVDLHVKCEESLEGLKVDLCYNPDLYTPERIERVGGHFQELLRNILTSPHETIGGLEMASREETRQILEVFNNTSCGYPKDKTIAELFEAVAEKYPDKPAVVFQGRVLTYRQLNCKSNHLARRLRNEYEVKLDEPVAIRMDRSHELVIAILGVLKSGGAYLPIDASMPVERVNTILNDAKTRIVVTDNGPAVNLFAAPHIVHVAGEYPAGVESAPNISAGKTSSHLAYVMYTSGSTGAPKGSMIEEKSVIRLVRNANYVAFDESDRLLSTSSIAFDATTLDLWGMLLNGGTLYLEKAEDYLDPEKLTGYLSEYEITTVFLSTGLFVRMVEADLQCNLNMFRGMKTIIVGGDRLPPRTANSCIALYPDLVLLNGYGPTENTTFTTVFRVAKECLHDVPIGSPISNTTVHIFNESGNVCPIGVPGEMFIGGEGLSRGYMNQPELNEQQFVINPLNKAERLYRSGDIGEWRADGTILFHGRKDDQLKIRGYRIETGEIENASAHCEGVTNTVVVAIQEEDQKELALYYTAGKEISKEDFRTYLGKTLPEYMLPKYVVRMETFPLNQNGKIDRRAFPKPEISPDQSEGIRTPGTRTERALTRIFENILNVGHVSRTDNFFRLGGNSLKAIRAVSSIQKVLSMKVSLKELFANPDVASLERIIRDRKRETLGCIPLIGESAQYRLSHAQRRLWVIDKIEKTKATYNIPLAVSVHDGLDAAALQSAFDDMIHKHESLRTIFVEIDGEPFQRIIHDRNIPIVTRDFSRENDPDAAALNYVVSEAHRIFSLSVYPLLRLYTVKTAVDKHIVMLNIHHIICDGWSVKIMIDELFGGYGRYGHNAGRPSAALPIQYKDYACWLNDKISHPENDSDRAYWLDKLGGEITPLDIPADFRRPAVKTQQGNSLRYPFSKELKAGLDAFNVEKRSSLFMTLTAALKVLLHKYTGKEDILIGTPVAGRNHPDLEDQIGCYVNTLVLRDRIDPESSFAGLLEVVKTTATDGYAHQMYPFDKLVEEIRLPRDTSRSPLFDVMIALQQFEDANSGAFKGMEAYNIPMNISKYDLTFTFVEAGDTLELVIEYNTQVYRRERIERMASHVFALLHAAIVNPAQSIKTINIVGKDEEHALLRSYNDTAARYPADKTIVRLWEESVAKYPGRIAVVFKETKLTYAELDGRSTHIAQCIAGTYAVSPGEPIGVVVSPSDNTMAILLAILKTGGAYVPIDPEYPDERIRSIISESKTHLVVVQTDNDIRMRRMGGEGDHDCVVLNLDLLPDPAGQNGSRADGATFHPDMTAYVMFTSGSTGKPKGCPISHRNIVRLFINDKSLFDFAPSDVWIMAHSYCFDLSVWEMYGALLFGGTLIVPERKEVKDVSTFVQLVRNHKITVLNQTPGAFYKFIDTVLEDRNKERLSLRYVILGGDKLNPAKLGKWAGEYPAERVQLINMYGITETTIHATYHRVTSGEIASSDGTSNVGKPLPETRIYILDNHQMLVPVGVYGEIHVAGTGLSKGYLNRPDLTAERFFPNPYDKSETLYKSGDVGRWLFDGTIEYLDRCDSQVQIRGFRVEMSEIELRLLQYPGIAGTVVVAVENEGTKELAAYIISDEELQVQRLRGFLSSSLPEYMIPSSFVRIDKIPLTSNGKLDRKSLPPANQNIATGAVFGNPGNRLEQELLELWQGVLSTESIGIHDDFFDAGGNSILLVKLHGRIQGKYPDVLELTDLFSRSNISEQAGAIARKLSDTAEAVTRSAVRHDIALKYHDVAIIGIAARIGDCETPDDFWKDLRMGVDCIGAMPPARIPDIKKLCTLKNINTDSLKFREYCYLREVDQFDCGFFKLSPREASFIDPGQRLFMETAYHALEDAGYGGGKLWGSRTGVFIGASDNLGEYAKYIEASEDQDQNLLLAALTPSILASRLSYHLNLKGPAMLVDTACSSSLVAVHLACQSIREGKIDSAVVGGIKLHLLPLDSGSRLEIDSSDSRGHSFDDSADGTGAGEGVIAMLIKPLEHALRDKDNVYAVIKGSEINQDGKSMGITAPDADAQADAIENAWLDAGIDPRTVGFIETHGTATPLGDPIEIDGITKAFRRYTSDKGFCAIGAVKANIGHLDTAAGLAGLLKVVLSLKHKQLAPMAHFKTPNRNIHFEESAAYINTGLTDWKSNGHPLRSGVSSFGLSGTNCHVIVEEAPPKINTTGHPEGTYLFTLSARSKDGLNEYAKNIRRALYLHPDTPLDSICHTLATGRGHYSHRLAIVCDNTSTLKQKLSLFIESEPGSAEAEGIFHGYSRIVASTTTNPAPGESTEDEIRTLSDRINAFIRDDADGTGRIRPAIEAYLKGADVSWEAFHGPSIPQKVSLPGYPFEKKRCWVNVRTKDPAEEPVNTSYGRTFPNIFLSNCIVDTPTAAVYANTVNEQVWLLNEHRVLNRPTMVGAAYLQMACEAGQNHCQGLPLRFEDFYLLQPLAVEEGKEMEVLTSITTGEEKNLAIEVHSRSDDNGWLTYARFRVSKSEDGPGRKLDVGEIRKRMTESREVVPEDEERKPKGSIQVSRKWNCLKKMYWNAGEYLAELSVPEADVALAEEYHLYPPLIDAALSFAIDESGFLPYSFGTVELRAKAGRTLLSYISRKTHDSPDTRVCDVTLMDESGNIIAVFRDVTWKNMSQLNQDNVFHELTWKSRPLNTAAVSGNGGALVLYNANCNPSLVATMKSLQGVTAREIVEDNVAGVFEQYNGRIPDKVAFILPEICARAGGAGIGLEDRLTQSLYGAFLFVKYLAANISTPIDLLFVGQNVCEVSGKESQLHSINNATAGLGQVLQRESPNIHCRFLDIDEYTTAAEIRDELHRGFTESFYYRSYRNGGRFIRELKRVNVADMASKDISCKEGGVYVITGGTGGIALELAHFLARQAPITLALINRSQFVARDAWDAILTEGKDEKLCRKIGKLLEIENDGAGIHFYSADVSDYDALATAMAAIRMNLGRIRGVIHAAGVPGSGFIFGKTIEQFRNVVRPKIHGLIYLGELVTEDKPDFLVMTSALTAILPTSGQSDYTAANCFMDAYASELRNSGIHSLNINLTAWNETGMAFEYGVAGDGVFKSLSTASAVSAFGRIIRKKTPSAILGEPDLSHQDAGEGLPFYVENGARVRKKRQEERKPAPVEKPGVSLRGRESGNYTECEMSIAQVWGAVLGYQEINIADNYYDLGGDSIHAIKIRGLLEKELNLQVTIGELFTHLTIAGFAGYLESKKASQPAEPAEDAASSVIVPAEHRSYHPVSSAQRRLFILDKLTKDKRTYHIPAIWNIVGKLNVEALTKAFGRLVERHEILRTSFDLVQDVPVQIVHDHADCSMAVSSMNEEEARSHVRGFVRPFDLGVAPLFRTEIVRLSPDNHLILFDAHHIIIDAFSMEILKNDIFSYYEGLEPEPLRIQYKDYAIWQSAYYKSREAAGKKSYWLRQCEGEIPVINLPVDYPRTANQSAEAGIWSFAIDEALTGEVKKLSANLGISTFMILLAVYNIVLHKYTQQEDIIVGVTSMGRDNDELSKLLGMFVNNLPVRTHPKDHMTVMEYLLEVKEAAINASANQEYPFDELIEDLHIKRDLNRSPLFDVVFSYMNFELSEITHGGLQISDYRAETVVSSEYDLALYGLEAEEKIHITVKYMKSLFTKQSMERFAGHFVKTVRTVTENRQLHLCDVEFLGPEEIGQLHGFNCRSKAIVASTDAIDMLQEVFSATPGRIAVLCNDRKMTYGELSGKANKLAHYLRSVLAVEPDDLVGIMVERTESAVVAMLGVLKSGAAYVGIDNAYPQNRIDYILTNSRTRILLTERSTLHNNSFVARPGTTVVDIDDAAIARQQSCEPVKVNSPGNVAYVIYTSGSTGHPKGVAITHGNLSVFMHWCRAEFASTDYEVVYATTSYCFDMSVFEIFHSLAAGKTIRILKSALDIPMYLGRDRQVLINTVPSLVSAIKSDLDRGGFSHISAMNLGGEPVPQSLLDGIDCDSIEVRNVYGPSEDTTYSTFYRISNKPGKVLIGRPISNTQIFIVDRSLKLLPIGHPGEICIAGDGLAKGYLFDEALTAQKFIPNPFGNGRFYRTGDLGRWTDTGDVEYLGRMDRQVKVRGFRIELGEIETHLSRHPAIENAVVIAYEKGTATDIAAYIVATADINVDDVRRYLSDIVPAYMVPVYVVMMDRLPLTPNGKIDIKALPAPDRDKRGPESSPVEMRNATEETLTGIWKNVLATDAAGIHDSFFDLGGHSLKALKLLSQINREFNSNCTLPDIFEYPTIAQFARMINRRSTTTVAALAPLAKTDYYDVSHAQRRLWILHRVDGNSIAYNIPLVYHIRTAVDIHALQKAFNALIHKYESLRTYFIDVDGEPKQAIAETAGLEMKVVEVNGTRDLVRDSKDDIQKAITARFNLEIAPLIKATLLTVDTRDEYVLIINVHHIVLDEWSIPILADALGMFYDHYSGVKIITDHTLFAPSPVQYKEYAYWHNRQLEENEATTNLHKKYWLDTFREPVQGLNFPADFQRPKTQTHEGKTESFTLPQHLYAGLKKLSADNDATLFMTTLALLHVLMVKYTGQHDLVIGTPIANRDHPDIQNQIGFFLNTLALRNQSTNDESFKSFLNRVKRNTLAAFSHCTYPFDLLVDALQLPGDLSRSPLFDVMLISQTPAGDAIPGGAPGLEMKSIECDYSASKYDLSVSYYEDGHSLQYFFEYNTALYRKERIENLFRHFSSLLESVLSDEAQAISQCGIVSPEEQEALLRMSAGCHKALVNTSVVSLIEQQAAKCKASPAVVFKRNTMTYEEVNGKANQLARQLIDCEGVKPGESICVMLERSEWSVIVLLATLKAGAVYVPVDPHYPQNRIDYILRDSGGSALITSRQYEKRSGFGEGKILVIEDLARKSCNNSAGNVNCSVSAELHSTAYIIYTSGSTGEPKGVLGTHKCLLNLIEWQSGMVEGGLKTLQYAPHGFDVSIQEILFSLATAGTLYMIDNEMRFTMSAIADIIEAHHIDILTMPYSALNVFLDDVENSAKLKSLKHLITSGEQPFTGGAIEHLLRMYPEMMLHNQYGPSETHVVASYTLCGRADRLPGKIPMGRPINNTHIVLLDNEMALVPVGIPGDVYIGGYNVANGYVRKPDLTGDCFIPNPFGEGKLYKSGDVARWDNHGELEFLGRDDRQVKVRGYRIELGEIEAFLLGYPDLKEAAVVLLDEGESREMAAYFTTSADVDIIGVREFAAAHLPGYMVPAYFVRLAAFARTPSGKIDLRSLPPPATGNHIRLSPFVEPAGETEIIIAGVWKEILRRDAVSSQDNFFEIGGNSIKAIQVMSRVQKRLGRKTFLNLIFQQPTIKQMAARIADTAERLKHLETDCTLLNQEHAKKVFFLPPGIGYCFAYMEYARYFDDYSVFGLNFSESASPAQSAAAILLNLQKEGEFYLFGHSAGGNMAYDVAIELQRQGREVGGLVLLDSYRQLELVDWSEDEYMHDAVLYIEQNHAEFLDEEIKDAALGKIVAYRKYLNARTEEEFLRCPIIQIEATGDAIAFTHKISRRAWSELTPQFEVFQGFGGHMDMLQQPNLKQNALLTRKLLAQVADKHHEANRNNG